jgi:hypothetical protein
MPHTDVPGYRQKCNVVVALAMAEYEYLISAARKSNMTLANYIREQLGLRLLLGRTDDPTKAVGGEESYYAYLVGLLSEAGFPDPEALLGDPEVEKRRREVRLARRRRLIEPSEKKIEEYEYESRMWEGGLRKDEPRPADPRVAYVRELRAREQEIPDKYRRFLSEAEKTS